MITNYKITVAREGHVAVINQAELQDTSSISKESSGVKKQHSTAVFIYGENDLGIKNGDFVLKGDHTALSEKAGKEFIQYAKLNGGQVVQAIHDNRKSFIPHIELECSI